MKLADPDDGGIVWELQYSGLTDSERNTIENFIREAEGRLHRFTFLDPAGNLLLWSEDLLRSVWQRDGLIQIGSGITDPAGSTRATRIVNGSQVEQGFEQTVACPGWFHYCFSAFIRSSTMSTATLAVSNADGTLAIEQTIGTEWTQIQCSGEIPGTSEDLTCRVAFNAGAAIEVYGLQLEPQPNPSGYQTSRERNGVYVNTRFEEDSLRFVANGVEDHSVVVRLYSSQGATE